MKRKLNTHDCLNEESAQREKMGESGFAQRRKPAYSLYTQLNPAYLCRLCISPTDPLNTHTHTHTQIFHLRSHEAPQQFLIVVHVGIISTFDPQARKVKQ